jgi:GNAT superfamily N-acetyltransferase
MGYRVKNLNETTWPDFVRLAERHNGVWGGCWCLGFHQKLSDSSEANKLEKERRVREGRAHAILVYDGDDCVGWCQFGPTEELPNIKYRRDYDKNVSILPDWRITCFFVARKHRGSGVASTALSGALEEIARLGGGTVEAYPEDFNGREVSKSLPYMYNGLSSMFEQLGFERVCRLGKHHWTVRKVVDPVPSVVTQNHQ